VLPPDSAESAAKMCQASEAAAVDRQIRCSGEGGVVPCVGHVVSAIISVDMI